MSDAVEFMKDWCEFGDERVYFLMALARPKENDELTDNSKPCIRLVVKNSEDIERKYERLKHAVERHDYSFRFYLSVNARNTSKAYFNFKSRMDKWCRDVFMGDENKDAKTHFKRIDKRWKSELQRSQNKDETFFIFDLDESGDGKRQAMEDAIVDAGGNCLRSRETPNGWHIVTEPFNYKEVEADLDYEVNTDSMIFLEMS